jgi:hypothetical protein
MRGDASSEASFFDANATSFWASNGCPTDFQRLSNGLPAPSRSGALGRAKVRRHKCVLPLFSLALVCRKN